MKKRGILTYTQHTVAFPHSPMADSPSVYDDINISFDAAEGGTYGEFKVTFHRFINTNWGWSAPRDNTAFQLCVFSDAFSCLRDERVQKLISWVDTMPETMRERMTPEKFVRKLEKLGMRPSTYHLNGPGLRV